MAVADVIAALQARFPELGLAAQPLCHHMDGRPSDQLWVRVPGDRLLEALAFLRDDPRTRFEMLADLTCIDYLNYPAAEERFAVIYALLSLTHGQRLWVKVFVNEPEPTLPSAVPLWKGANWMEREVFDMFGVRFSGHPDLRRILTPETFTEHPLRKDYPLSGRGEREAFETVTREQA
jgi:NADH-quinone oxidoreductase subunit C